MGTQTERRRKMNVYLRSLLCSILAFATVTVQAQLAPSLTASPAAYTPGEDITLNFVFNYTGTATDSAFVKAGFEATLPDGWGDANYDGSLIPDSPMINLFQPATHRVSVGWATILGSSDPGATVTIPFTVSVPAGFTGSANISVSCVWGDDTKFSASLTIPRATTTVTFVAAIGGGVSGDSVQTGDIGFTTTPVTAVPNAGWTFLNWTLDGAEYATDNPLTVANVRRDWTIQANFTTSYSVVFAAGAGGSIAPDTAINQTVVRGHDAAAVTAVPNTGFRFVNWTGDYVGAANPLTVTNVTGTMNITANFTAVGNHIVTFAAGANGSVSGSKLQAIANGGSCSAVTAEPDAGYKFTNWSGDLASSANPLTVDNVTADMAISANFAVIANYTVTFVAGDNGGISGLKVQTVPEGTDCDTVVAEPNDTCYFDRWTGDVDSLDTALQVKNVTKNMTITANFVDQQAIHVAPGSVFTLNLAAPLNKKPKVSLNSVNGSKAKVLNSAKEFKSEAGVTALRCQWTSVKDRPQRGGSLYLDKEDVAVTKYFSIEPPTMPSMSPTSGSGALKPPTTVTVKGQFFGSTRPKVYMTYGDAQKKVNCNVAKPTQVDAAGKLKSYMDVNTGYSELTFTVPKKITEGTAATLHVEFKFAPDDSYEPLFNQ